MEKIDLIRKNGIKIENECQFNNNENLGIIFSGLGYTYKNPLLYYSRSLLFDHNIDYIGIDFKYYDDQFFTNLSDEGKDKYFEDDNEMVIDKLLKLVEKYKKVILIGKSMGTSVIKRCLKYQQIKEKAIIVLLTPGDEWENIIEEIKNVDNKILVIGSFQDKFYNVKNITEIYNKSNIETYELQKGNHSLEIKETIKDIEQLKLIMEKIRMFIEENV